MIHCGVHHQSGAVQSDPASRQHRASADQIQRALVDDSPARVGVVGGKIQDTRPRLHQHHRIPRPIVCNHRIDDHVADTRGECDGRSSGSRQLAERDLRRAVHGDHIGAVRDVRSCQDHSWGDAHGGIHGDHRRTQGRVSENIGTAGDGLIAGPRCGGDVAHRHLREAVDGHHRGAGGQVAVGESHANLDALRRSHGQHIGAKRGCAGGGKRRVAARIVVDDQFTNSAGFTATCSDHTTNGAGADAGVKSVVAAKDAAQLQVQHIGTVGESDVVGEVSAEAQQRRRGGGAAERGGKRCRGQRAQVGDLAAAENGVITGKTAVAYDANAVRRVVSGVVSRIGYGPCAKHTRGVRGQGACEIDARVVARIAQVRACEIDRGASRTSQAREGEVHPRKGSTTGVGGNHVGSLRHRQCAHRFRGIRGQTAVDRNGASVHEDGDRITNTIIDLSLQAGVVVQGERGVVQRQTGRAEQRRVILQCQCTAHHDGRTAIGLGGLQGQRVATNTHQVDIGAVDHAREGRVASVHVGHQRPPGRAAVHAPGGARQRARPLQLAHILGVTIQVQRGPHTDVQHPAAWVDGVRSSVEPQRPAQNVRGAAVVLERRKHQGASKRRGKAASARDCPGHIEGRASLYLEVTGVRPESNVRLGKGVVTHRIDQASAGQRECVAVGASQRQTVAGNFDGVDRTVVADGRIGGQVQRVRGRRGVQVVARVVRPGGQCRQTIGTVGDKIGATDENTRSDVVAHIESGARRKENLVRAAQAADTAEIQSGPGVGKADRGKGQRIGTRSRHQDRSHDRVDRHRTRSFRGIIADELQRAAIDGDGTRVEQAVVVVRPTVVKGQRATGVQSKCSCRPGAIGT